MSEITPNIPIQLKKKEEEKTKNKNFDYINDSNITINIISEILEEIVEENNNLENENKKNLNNDNKEILKYKNFFQNFISKKIPKITIKNYLNRLMKYSKPEPSTVIICLIYIDKLCEKYDIQLTYYNIHR